MNNDFPRMLYKSPGLEQIHGGKFATLIVGTENEQSAALDDGWCMSTPEALDAAKVASSPSLPLAEPPPTREELEAKAKELNIKFDGRTSDKKLVDLIKATLEV